MSRRYRVTHHTSYAYDEDVTDSYGLVYGRPREDETQRLVEHELWTDPGHADLGEHHDSEGNQATFFHVTEPHRRLSVSVVSLVDVDPAPHPVHADVVSWEDTRPQVRRDVEDWALASQYVWASPLVDLVPAAAAYASTSFAPGRPLVEAVLELTSRVHTDFDYHPGSTTVATTVDDVLAQRKGVCQDFAHLMLSCLRSQGLAARYVSGYLAATEPPPGRSRTVGADATHAWVHVWLPGLGWLSVDPTNDCETSDRHITVAWGRDYADVPPVKGVIFTEAKESTMRVAVDVAPIG